MKIIKIECTPITQYYPHIVKMGGLNDEHCASVLVKMYTDEGITGIADTGSTYYWYRGETQESIMTTITKGFAPILLGEDPFNIEKIVAKMDYICRDNFQAKSVVDFCLHDIVGKALNIPVYKLLGGKSQEKIPLVYVLYEDTADEVQKTAIKVKNAGYQGIKMKVNAGDDVEDTKKLAALREAVGDGYTIFCDANGTYHYYEALKVFKKMERYDIEYFEQPLPWNDVDGLARLRKKTSIPIYADESAVDLSQVYNLIAHEAVDGFLIKVCKVGGLRKAMQFMTIAKAAGLAVTCGCVRGNGFEGAAGAHFLTACEWATKQMHQNNGPAELHGLLETYNVDITDDPAKNVLVYKGGYQYVPEGPGLGVDLNEEIIPKLVSPGVPHASVSLDK